MRDVVLSTRKLLAIILYYRIEEMVLGVLTE